MASANCSGSSSLDDSRFRRIWSISFRRAVVSSHPSGLSGQPCFGHTDNADAKAKAAIRWVNAVNRLAHHGTWHYLLITDPGMLGRTLNGYTAAKWDEEPFELL